MGDRRKCQTYTASPAEPGGLPVMLGGSAMQYAHWLMVAGAVLVVLGFIGFALRKNDAEDHLMLDTSSETIQAA